MNPLKKELFELFFPSNIYCISCGNLIDETRPYSLCDICLKRLKWTNESCCEKCGKAIKPGGKKFCDNCMKWNHSFTKGFSCVEYSNEGRDIVHNFKYGKKPYYGEKIAEIMYDKLKAEEGISEIDLILPVPMHIKKQRERGFNQADLIGKPLSSLLNVDYSDSLLIRKEETAPMSSLGSMERLVNLEKAFYIAEEKKAELKDKRVLIIDDVYTTGTTMDGCAEILKSFGGIEIFFYSLRFRG